MDTAKIILITLVAYKVVLLCVGVWASRRVKTEGDFFLAGQGLGPWVAGLSYAASTSSAWVLLGFTGAVYAKGLVALWLIPGIFGGYILTWLVIGPRLNAATRKHGHITIVDYIASDAAAGVRRAIKLVCAAIILFCFVFYIASQFDAAGNALTSAFDISKQAAIITGAAVIVVYCLFGGFWAASITDALQAVIMVCACVLVPIATLLATGGFGQINLSGAANLPENYLSLTKGAGGMAGLGVALGMLGTGLGALGQPQLLNRIMAVKSESARRKGAMITVGWGVLIYSGLVLLAVTARSYAAVDTAIFDASGEKLFYETAQAFLPPVVAGVVIAAVLSAVMSTVDSLFLAAASAVSHDSEIAFKNPLLAGRIAMIFVAIVAVALSLYLPEKIFSRVLFAWVAIGAAFGPVVLLKSLGVSIRGKAILAAILVGFFTAVIAYNLGRGAEGDMKTLLGVVEKWVSWILGLIILIMGRERD